MKLIVGLGNPGKEFEGTRHNAGFMAVDKLAEELSVTWKEESRWQAMIAVDQGKKAILVKPLIFMNLSGQVVQAMARYYKIDPSDIWVIYDDVDLPVGTARIKGQGTGESSHNGIKSVVQALGTTNFARFRIGIASPKEEGNEGENPDQPIELKQFVLAPFDKRELPLLEKAIAWTVAEIMTALEQDEVTAKTLTKGV